MNTHGSDFEYGKNMLLKLIVASILAAVASLFFTGTVQTVLVAVTCVFFAGAVWSIVKYCRCPHCDKVIFAGVLSIRQCPRCRHDLYTGKKAKKSRKY